MVKAADLTAWLILDELRGISDEERQNAYKDIIKSRNEALKSTHLVIAFDLLLMLYIGVFVVSGQKDAGESIKISYNEHVGTVLFLLGNTFFAAEMGNFFRVVVAEKLIFELSHLVKPSTTFNRTFNLHFSNVATYLRRRLPLNGREQNIFKIMSIYNRLLPAILLNIVLYLILILFITDLWHGGDILCETTSIKKDQCIIFTSPFWLRCFYIIILLGSHGASAFFTARVILDDLEPDSLTNAGGST